MQDGENRRLLGEWLANEPGYQPIVADSDEMFTAEFDCVVVDTATLSESGDDLSARRRMEPVFLAVLLLLPKRSGATRWRPSNSSRGTSVAASTTPSRRRSRNRRSGTGWTR